MRVRVQLMRRNGRVLIAADRDKQPPYAGFLSVTEKRDAKISRTLVQARLISMSTGTGVDLLPALNDVQLLWAENNEMRLTGIERINDVDYAQTWSVEVAPC